MFTTVCKSLLFVSLMCFRPSFSQTYCRRERLVPHSNGYWQEGFPFEDPPKPLCEGTITIGDDGSICVEGRVNYEQISIAVRDKLNKAIYTPTAPTISITGHLSSGAPNMFLGVQKRYLYDFVTNYTIEGTTYVANNTITNYLLGASRGLLEGVCLDPSFAEDDYDYTISHKFFRPKGNIDYDVLKDAGYFFIGPNNIVAETYTRGDDALVPGSFFNRFSIFLQGLVPTFAFRILPFLGKVGIFRQFVFGKFNTEKWPQPILAPEARIEGIQIETEFTTLQKAMENGLWTTNGIPQFLTVLAKSLFPFPNKNTCWNETTVVLDIQAPSMWGTKLDEHVENEVYPALKEAGGTILLHFGKRIPKETETLAAAMVKLESCGVELNLSPDPCYHPYCTRSNSYTEFVYPPGLVEF